MLHKLTSTNRNYLLDFIFMFYIAILVGILTIIFYSIIRNFYSYICGIILGLIIGFLTEDKLKKYIYKKLNF